MFVQELQQVHTPKKKIQICPYIAYCYPLKKLARLPDISAKMSSIIILQWMQQKKSHQKKLDFYNSFEYWKKWAMSLIYLALHFLLFNTNWQPKKISTCLYRSILLWLKKTVWHKCDFFLFLFWGQIISSSVNCREWTTLWEHLLWNEDMYNCLMFTFSKKVRICTSVIY